MLVGQFMDILGSPWAAAKTQPVSPCVDFLGLVHDVADVPAGVTRFWPREALITKVNGIMSEARRCGGLLSGVASKPYGVATFL